MYRSKREYTLYKILPIFGIAHHLAYSLSRVHVVMSLGGFNFHLSND